MNPDVANRHEPAVWCPDCQQRIVADRFTAHRELEHPPAPVTLTATGINSATRFGTDPKEN